jgi:deoxyadenosine/deoxycytidine kinase
MVREYDGRIIAVVGGAGSGKSYLCDKLARHYGTRVFKEGEKQDLPSEVTDSFRTGKGLFNTIVWFRNKQVKEYSEALRLRDAGETVVMDTFWITYQLHINPYLKEGFERSTALDMADVDRKSLPWPDVVIYIRSDDDAMMSYMKRRDRDWEGNPEFIRMMTALNEEHDKFFSENKVENLIVVERKDNDFEKEEDFKKLLSRIDSLDNI